MKTFITVIFFGILTYTDAKKTVETCQNSLQIKPGLNIPSFFTGVWYTTHMMDASSAATCRAYKFEQNPNGILLTYTGQVTVSGNTKQYTVTCSSKELNPSAPILFKCAQSYTTVYHTPGNEFFDLRFSVIETDYGDHALVYRCMKYDDEKDSYGMYMILQRNKNGNGDKAKESLKKNKWEFSKFKKFSC
uniref:Salivary lipocalin n=1 Tax=Triatoma infestans TaxID=30076 RepID=A6YPM0_TRIIF|nr:salivary lipocalin [Triatoma infestans]